MESSFQVNKVVFVEAYFMKFVVVGIGVIL